MLTIAVTVAVISAVVTMGSSGGTCNQPPMVGC